MLLLSALKARRLFRKVGFSFVYSTDEKVHLSLVNP